MPVGSELSGRLVPICNRDEAGVQCGRVLKERYDLQGIVALMEPLGWMRKCRTKIFDCCPKEEARTMRPQRGAEYRGDGDAGQQPFLECAGQNGGMDWTEGDIESAAWWKDQDRWLMLTDV